MTTQTTLTQPKTKPPKRRDKPGDIDIDSESDGVGVSMVAWLDGVEGVRVKVKVRKRYLWVRILFVRMAIFLSSLVFNHARKGIDKKGTFAHSSLSHTHTYSYASPRICFVNFVLPLL